MYTDQSFNRGGVWLADLDPQKEFSSGRARLVLLVSATTFNIGPAELVLVVPMTTREQSIPMHVRIAPPEGGLDKESFAQCDQVQCVSRQRLIEKLGVVERKTMEQVSDRLSIILDLFQPV